MKDLQTLKTHFTPFKA